MHQTENNLFPQCFGDDRTNTTFYFKYYLKSLSIDYSVSWMQPPEYCVQWAGMHMCPTYCATICIGYACHRGSSSNYAFWCIRHCTGWRQTTLDSLSARTMLAVLSGLRSASRERRQSSATEHSPSPFLWCETVCQRQSEIPTPCQTSNLLWSLTCLLHYSRGCTNSYDLWRRPWIGLRVMAP